ncbi:MAG: transcription termination factor Rho [Clostridia bacterium]
MDYANYTQEKLSEHSLFELRYIGREFGVQSPTSLKKDELISSILEIISGTQPPQKSRRGRPPKSLFHNVNGANGEDFVYDSTTEQDFVAEDSNDTYLEDTIVEEDVAPPVVEEVQDTSTFTKEGILDIHPDGYGFLRAENCEHGDKDAYVSSKIIRMLGLRRGDYIVGLAKQANENKPAGVTKVTLVNDMPSDTVKFRPNFDNLVPIYPNERFSLEFTKTAAKNDYAIRCIDLIAPIGKGQRAMIVSPPKAGKTTLLKNIANSIACNYPEVKLIVLLVDERPEEVTDMQRSIRGEVVYSTFDETPEHHTKAAELVVERAKRLVELGQDVVIIMDSLTRLARAYNLTIPPTGRTLSGGIDPGALHNPKRFFGSARNIENGGSLTIVATALIDTGSRMDDVIYEEFKGTGNMEIHLDRKLSEKRIFPAIDLARSGTRREDLLLSQKELEGVWSIRKMLSSGDGQEATEKLYDMLIKTKNNAELMNQITTQIKLMQKDGYTFRK